MRFQPLPQRGDGPGSQGRGSLFSALTAATNVRPRCEHHVFAAQTGEFGDTQTGLDCDGEQRVVATTDPGVLVGNGEDCLDLLFGEERNDVAIESFLWDRQGPRDEIGVFGVLERGELEQRMDRGQAGVAGSYAVASLVFQVGEECSDGWGVEVVEVQARRRELLCVGDESEEQPERVAVGGDGGRAGLPLGEEAVGEELLQGGSEGAHGSSPRNSSRRRPTMVKSSGAASRYQ
jgi:hypothetical protein